MSKMTDAEINQKFDVVAGHLATLAVGLRQLQEVQTHAEKRWENTENGIRSLLAIAELHAGEIEELRASNRAAAEELRESGKATDERLNALINIVERYISEGRK